MTKPVVHGLEGKEPIIGLNTWIAPGAVVVGEVYLGANCSIWYHAVLRADVAPIRIGDDTNIQDGAMVHATRDKSATVIGNRVTVGHRAIIHGCTIEDEVLIGMGAIVLDNAYIESGAIVAAGAVILENTRVLAGTIWAGIPARQVKMLDSALSRERMREMSASYVGYKELYR